MMPDAMACHAMVMWWQQIQAEEETLSLMTTWIITLFSLVW